jgi:hypothetical protein
MGYVNRGPGQLMNIKEGGIFSRSAKAATLEGENKPSTII